MTNVSRDEYCAVCANLCDRGGLGRAQHTFLTSEFFVSRSFRESRNLNEYLDDNISICGWKIFKIGSRNSGVNTVVFPYFLCSFLAITPPGNVRIYRNSPALFVRT